MIHILREQGSINEHQADLITAQINEAMERFATFIPFKPIDIVVADNKWRVIPEHGVGGYAATTHELYISLDMSLPDIENYVKEYLPATIAHELAHIVRAQAEIPFLENSNLAHSVVGEGLADHMSLSLYPEQDIPWTSALDDKTYEEMLARFHSEKDDKNYDHNAWFYGAEYTNIPRWTGYTLGFKLVGQYLKNHPETKIQKILTLPAEEFLR